MNYNQFTPGGSYQLTSRDITVTINAECQARNGSWQKSAPLTYTADQAQKFPDISNNNGTLEPIIVQPAGTIVSKYGIAVPAGSYQITSRNIEVTVNAVCQKRDGSWQQSAPFTFTTDESGKYPEGIVNNNGELSFTL